MNRIYLKILSQAKWKTKIFELKLLKQHQNKILEI